MVRSRIASRPAFAATDTLPATDRWAGSHRANEGAHVIEREAVEQATDRPAGPFAFVLEIVAPWFGRTARSVGLGCLLALGCGPGERVELEGVVRDGRTGDPVAGAQITTEDGRTLETDHEGRFSVSAREGERVVARARGRCDAYADVEGAELSLRSFERIELLSPRLDVELDTEVRIEVRTPCDDGAPVHWQQVSGPVLGPDQLRFERGGRVLVLRTHGVEQLEGRTGGTYRLEVSGELGDERIEREVIVTAGAVPTGACAATAHALGMGCAADAGPCATSCASCHGRDHPPDASRLAPEIDEWQRSEMSHARSERATDGDVAGPITCGTCHDAESPSGLRVHDAVPSVGGAPAEHLGSGAICASCHRDRDSDVDTAPRSPQTEVLLGRGARVVDPMDDGAHRFIVDTCVRCHMTRPPLGDPRRGHVGGHTFALRTDAGFHESACTPCHGDVRSDAIGGVRDRDGDGRAGSVRDEHAAGLARVQARLRDRIRALDRRDGCTPARVAVDVVEHATRLQLVDERGVMLGDCDANGAFEDGETAVTARALPPTLRDVAHDVVMLRSDGSAGLHNPAYVFRVIGAALRALE